VVDATQRNLVVAGAYKYEDVCGCSEKSHGRRVLSRYLRNRRLIRLIRLLSLVFFSLALTGNDSVS